MRNPALLLPFLLAACESVPVPPPQGGATGVVAIQVRTQERTSAETVYPTAVWFVRLEEGDDPDVAGPVLKSSYHHSGHVYLLNAAPGRYCAVACAVLIDGKLHHTFFPPECVRATRGDLPEGGWSYLGLCRLRIRPGLGEDDRTEQHYAAQILPQGKQDVVDRLFPRNLSFTATRWEVDRAAERDEAARKRARKILGKAGWSDRLP